MRRRRRKYSGPKRPVRWIYSGQWENTNEETDCAVDWISIPCGLPVAEKPAPGADPDIFHDDEVFWHELLRGETDLDWSDKSAPCVTRIVGDCSVRAGWNLLTGSNPGFDPPIAPGSFLEVPPIVRLGICVIDEPEGVGWIPPDLWDADDGDGMRWLWRAQHSFSRGSGGTNFKELLFYADSPATAFGVGSNRMTADDWEMHIDIRVNATVNKNQSLVMVHSHRFNAAADVLPPGLIVQVEDLSFTRVGLLHDLRCLVKS